MINKIPENVKLILKTLESNNFNSYIVGGAVRDLLLSRTPNDWDIVTQALPDDVERIFDNTIAIGKAFGIINVIIDGETFDVATLRVDGEYSDTRHPDKVEFTRNLKDDLRRRDFTINSMCMDLKGKIYDYYGGLKDLKLEVIRCVGDMGDRFKEDALRILRAYRFSAQLDFSLSFEIVHHSWEYTHLLENISKERIMSEWNKILLNANRHLLKKITINGLMKYISPNTFESFQFYQHNPYHSYDVLEHTLRAVELVPRDLTSKLIMFYHDIGKPDTFKIEDGRGRFIGHAKKSVELTRENMRELKYDNKTIEIVCKVIEFHDYFLEPKKKAIKKLLNKMGNEYFELWYNVRWADILSQNLVYAKERLEKLMLIKKMYNEIIENREVFTIKKLAVSGNDIIDWGFAKQGKEVGNILNDILEAILNGEVINSAVEINYYLNGKYGNNNEEEFSEISEDFMIDNKITKSFNNKEWITK